MKAKLFEFALFVILFFAVFSLGASSNTTGPGKYQLQVSRSGFKYVIDTTTARIWRWDLQKGEWHVVAPSLGGK